MVRADGSGILLNADYRDPELRRHPWHEFDATGQHVRGFGPQGDYLSTVEEGRGPLPLMMRRLSTLEPDGDQLRFHEGSAVGYRLEAQGPDGSVVRRIGLHPLEWRGMWPLQMTPEEVRSRREEARRPTIPDTGPAAITDLHALGDGLLLVHVNIPGLEWDGEFEYDTVTFPAEPQVIPHTTRGLASCESGRTHRLERGLTRWRTVLDSKVILGDA